MSSVGRRIPQFGRALPLSMEGLDRRIGGKYLVLLGLAAGIAMPAPEGLGPWAAVFWASDCHIRVSMWLGRADLHPTVRRVNLFRGRRFARDHIEIPIAACVVAAAVHGCAFKNILPKQRRRVG